MQHWIWLGSRLLYLGLMVYCLCTVRWLRGKLIEAQKPKPLRSWPTVMEHPRSPQENVIVAMVCALSVQDAYARLTPDEIYDRFVQEAKDVAQWGVSTEPVARGR